MKVGSIKHDGNFFPALLDQLIDQQIGTDKIIIEYIQWMVCVIDHS